MNKTIAAAARKVGWTEEFLRDLNAVLHAPEITPIGAYCVGVVHNIWMDWGMLPDRRLLEEAARCTNIPEAIALAKRSVKAAPPSGKKRGRGNPFSDPQAEKPRGSVPLK